MNLVTCSLTLAEPRGGQADRPLGLGFSEERLHCSSEGVSLIFLVDLETNQGARGTGETPGTPSGEALRQESQAFFRGFAAVTLLGLVSRNSWSS